MIRLTALLNNYQVTRDNDWLRANIGWVTDGPTTPAQAEIERIALAALAAQIELGNVPLRAIGFNPHFSPPHSICRPICRAMRPLRGLMGLYHTGASQ